jgi:cell wall-associated NlpC family hydrolase
MGTPSGATSGRGVLVLAGVISALITAGVGFAVTAVLGASGDGGSQCGSTGGGAASVVLGPPGSGAMVGATEYGGPGDPMSGSIGASGAHLLSHPDSYAELGGTTFTTAVAMGGLAYMTPLRISWGRHSAVAYKRDFGLGGAPVAGLPRVIDLWWQFAGALGIPYERGLWSGPVRVTRTPDAGAGNVLGQAAGVPGAVDRQSAVALQAGLGGQVAGTCREPPLGGVALTPGPRAQLLPDGRAAAPRTAPAAVKGIIAAGNQIVGKPYVYGGSHGLALDRIGSGYDCSSSVEHLLYGGRLLAVGYGAASGALESFGAPGPGRWVTIYTNADHVFMYVAGLRWDTHNAAGSQDGSAGIGWHPLVRSSAGFVVRHPVGL